MPIKGVGLSAFARLVWTAAILVIFGIGWLAYSKFDIDRLRGADYFVDKARQAVDAKDWPAALAAIRKVPGEARDESRFWRLLADYLIGTRTEPEMLIQALDKLDGTPLWQSEDGVWLAQASLARGRTSAARAALEKVPSAGRDSLFYLDTSVALLRSEGRPRDAAEVEKLIFSRFADDPGVAVRKAARELTGTFPEIQQAAVQRLWEISQRKDEHGLAAMRLLTAYRGLTQPQALRLQEAIAAHPAATANDRFAIASALLRVAPEKRDAILREEIERLKGAEGQTLQQLVAWLAKEKAFGEILKIVPRESLAKSVELFPAVAQDLAQREQWGELMGLIEKGRSLPVSNARAAGWRALAVRHLHPADTRAARAHLEEAIAEGLAKDDHQALSTAITLAEQWNMLDLALDATMKLAVPGSAREGQLLEKCWQLASSLRQDATLAKIVERLDKLQPNNPIISRRRDYLRLLRGDQIEVTMPSADERLERSTSSSDARLILQALKAYRMQDIASAAAIVGRIDDTRDLSSGESAVYAGLLARLCGRTTRAYQLAEKIRPEVLLEQELTFLQMALK